MIQGGVEEDECDTRPPPRVPVVNCFAWLVVMRGEGDALEVGMARSATVTLPPKIVALMNGNPPMEARRTQPSLQSHHSDPPEPTAARSWATRTT